ncbi:HEPN domain-containing protein [Lysobacter sp.]|uniref:HEPN domain-containing protein n=1 Tax=Lysobacter sp. TaxID=72226 RepID=UPI002D5C529E|nr:HEPN domain-containing protein [Lysobacter sp.]HZX78923.1 HEPN domain-containing protein [Lysobacter sp.]
MAYKEHFRLVDDVAGHFDAAVGAVDAFLQSRYVGFYAVAAAAVIELALKEIVVDFASRNHHLFGDYVESKYQRINGRVKLEDIVKEHLKPFGKSYQKRFEKLLKRVDKSHIAKNSFSVKLSYDALFTCRHQFSHEGSVPTNSGYEDVKRGFEAGKVVMACLAKVLGRTA